MKSGSPVFAYGASKGLAERIVWEDKERKFPVTTINPGT